jgi:hypothetical protein
MCRWALVLLVACSSKAAEPPPPASASKLVLPPSAFEIHYQDIPVGLRDTRTVITFCLPKDKRSELASLPCQAPCVSRKLHTEITIELEERSKELFVTIVDAEYDNCLFEGCPKHGP